MELDDAGLRGAWQGGYRVQQGSAGRVGVAGELCVQG